MLQRLFFAPIVLLCVSALIALTPVQAQPSAPITFHLSDDRGPVTHHSYPGRYLLLAIGYANCPDICPTTLFEFAQTLKQLRNPDAVVPVFVGIDPVNDTPETLNIYTRHFDPRIVGLLGDMSAITHLTQQLGATFGYRLNGKRVTQPEKGVEYNVYHSSLVYLIDPDRRLIDVFDYQAGAEGLSAALNAVLPEAPGTARTVVDPGSGVQAPAVAPLVTTTPLPASQGSEASGKACPLPTGFVAHRSGVALSAVLPEALRHQTPPPVALVNLWALWCAPCRAELPVLNDFKRTHPEVPVYTLNASDSEQAIIQYFAQHQLSQLLPTRTKGLTWLKKLGGKGLPFNALFLNGEHVANKSGIIEQAQSLVDYAHCVQSTSF